MKNKIITVWGNSGFACELAYAMAKFTGRNICILDLDLLYPSVDLFLGVDKYINKTTLGKNLTSYDILENAVEQNCLTAEILLDSALKINNIKNLFIYTGCFDISKYEYYSQEALIKIIDNCRNTFNTTIIIASRSIYDLFTCISLYKSDINLVPINAYTYEMRHYKNYINFLYEKQDIPVNKNKFVAYNYDAELHANIEIVKELSKNNYLGFISATKRRNDCYKSGKPYSHNMEYKILCQYKIILHKLGYIPKVTVKERISGSFKKYNPPGRKEHTNAADSVIA